MMLTALSDVAPSARAQTTSAIMARTGVRTERPMSARIAISNSSRPAEPGSSRISAPWISIMATTASSLPAEGRRCTAIPMSPGWENFSLPKPLGQPRKTPDISGVGSSRHSVCAERIRPGRLFPLCPVERRRAFPAPSRARKTRMGSEPSVENRRRLRRLSVRRHRLGEPPLRHLYREYRGRIIRAVATEDAGQRAGAASLSTLLAVIRRSQSTLSSKTSCHVASIPRDKCHGYQANGHATVSRL